MGQAGDPFCVGVDWGTTSFRLWVLARNGDVLGERRSAEGMSVAAAAGAGGFDAVLDAHLAALGVAPSIPVLICGMAGARQGWREVPYLDSPARLRDLAGQALRVEHGGRDIRILPGIAQRDRNRPDVMRGEETLILGLLPDGRGDGLVCLPGTHSKWVRLDGDTVERFSTFMTGEIFALLGQHSILRHSVGSPDRAPDIGEPFRAAVMEALEEPGRVTGTLFGLRARGLLFEGGEQDALAQLSGLLIGLELAGARSLYGDGGAVTLIASGTLGGLYQAALTTAGVTVTPVDAASAARAGLLAAALSIWP